MNVVDKNANTKTTLNEIRQMTYFKMALSKMGIHPNGIKMGKKLSGFEHVKVWGNVLLSCHQIVEKRQCCNKERGFNLRLPLLHRGGLF